MSGRETLRYAASFYPWVEDPIDARVDGLLELVGLTDAAERRTRTYSGGMRQRLGIAQALVGRPSVLLLDEPVSALDPIGRKAAFDLLEQLKGETTIFYSTHILEDVERVSDYVAILDHGRLVRAAPTAELLASFTRDQLRVTFPGPARGRRRRSRPARRRHTPSKPGPTDGDEPDLRPHRRARRDRRRSSEPSRASPRRTTCWSPRTAPSTSTWRMSSSA